jgi:hypothetical protein
MEEMNPQAMEPQAPEQEMAPQESEQGMEPQAPEGEDPKVDKKLKKEINIFSGGISKLLHGKETKTKIYEMLKSAPAEKSVPAATFHTNMLMYKKLKSAGKTPSMEAMFGGAVFTTSELIEIGNAGGFFKKEIGQEEAQGLLKASLQTMIEEGVRAKILDPIELQMKIEPMLNEQQRAMGLEAAQASGIAEAPGTSHAMEQYANTRVEQERQMMAKRMAGKNNQGMMQQAAQGGQR